MLTLKVLITLNTDMKDFFSRKVSVLVLLLAVAIGVSSCAGKRATDSKSEKAAKQVEQIDITRPPQTIGAEREIVVEQNPNETISFEEWKRRQEAATKAEPK